MITMGFPKEEITDSLVAQKYDEVMATYLLLGRKPPEARTTHTASLLFSKSTAITSGYLR